MSERIIIGLGTGRCGTNSLQYILNKLEGTNITHEKFPVNKATWIPSNEYFNKMCDYFDQLEENIAGDIAFFHLPYFYLYKERYEKIKFIGLKRNKEATIESILKKTEGRNHLSYPNPDYDNPIWDIKYPKFYQLSKTDALSSYYDMYYGELFYLQDLFPKQVRVFDLDNLNSVGGLRKIFRFLELPVNQIDESFVNVRENSIEVTRTTFKKRSRLRRDIKKFLRRL